MSDDQITLPDGRTFTRDEYADLFARLRKEFRTDQLELKPQQVQKGQQAKAKCAPDSRQNVSADGEFCGGYHAWSIHLTYVGHAGIRDRLTEIDPAWSWEPLTYIEPGVPAMSHGGMWGKLTVLGVTKIGFGDAQGKDGPNATKEMIGDFIRNAAMNFGVGTYLWSKSEEAARKKLGEAEAETGAQQPQTSQQQQPAAPDWRAELDAAAGSVPALLALMARARSMGAPPEVISAIGQAGQAAEQTQAQAQGA